MTTNNSIRKISDINLKEVCIHPEHKLPTHMVFPDGVYEHTCPKCGKKTTFTVRSPMS